MRLALDDAGLAPDAIGYVNAHGTATEWRRHRRERRRPTRCSARGMPISSLKGYFGHTLGACGAIEAWLGIEMMRERLVRADRQPRRTSTRAARRSTTSWASRASSTSNT